jgi:hypothetical protein
MAEGGGGGGGWFKSLILLHVSDQFHETPMSKYVLQYWNRNTLQFMLMHLYLWAPAFQKITSWATSHITGGTNFEGNTQHILVLELLTQT